MSEPTGNAASAIRSCAGWSIALLAGGITALAMVPPVPVAAAIYPGEPAPPLNLEALLQAPHGTVASWEALRGSSVVLEFWATWCGPCLVAIPHLNELAREFAGRPVRFIAISDEEPETVTRHLAKQAIQGWVGLDTDHSTFADYDVPGIPVTVLVDANGIVRAVTRPMSVTAEALDALIRGEAPGVPPAGRVETDLGAAFAADGPESLFEVTVRHSASTAASMQVGAAVGGASTFRGVGMTLRALLTQAYDMPASRLVIAPGLPEGPFDVGVVTPGGAEVRGALLRQAIEQAFDLRTRHEAREVDVYILTGTPGPAGELRPSALDGMGFQSGNGSLSGVGLTMDDLARALERAMSRPVVNETDVPGRFDLTLRWDPPQQEAIPAALQEQTGLELRPGRRAVDVLIVERGASG